MHLKKWMPRIALGFALGLACPAQAQTTPWQWTPTGSLTTARAGHTATLLNNGMVLIAGGVNSGGLSSSSAELYNPATGTFTVTGSLTTARTAHTATLLNNGMVLIAGGVDNSGLSSSSAELYNPATGTFTVTGSLTTARTAHTATLLNNGMALIAGGVNSGGLSSSSAELYNPATGTFTVTGSLTTARTAHTATLLNNGMVLVAAGFNINTLVSLSSAELYNPSTGTFTATGSLTTARSLHTATLLNNGMVLVAGGVDAARNPLSSAELYNPSTGTFTATASLNTARAAHAATPPNNGMVLISGGIGSTGVLSSAELYSVLSITGLSPAMGLVGTSVTITGTNFGTTQGTSTVTFNGVPATPTSWSATSIAVPVPTAATTGIVVVTVAGLASNGVVFTVLQPPSITNLNPTSGPPGTSVTITGANFGTTQGTSTVTFNGVAGTPTSWSATSIVVPVPNGATNGNVVVTVGGIASNGVAFTVVPPPTITGFSPTSASVGTLVSVTGSNFTANGATPQITLSAQGGGTIPAPLSSFSANGLSFVIPAGAASGPVTVTVGTQHVTSSSALNIVASSSFSLTATPNVENLIQGQSISYAVALSSTNGFSQLAALSVSGLPAGLTAAFSPQQITAGQSSVLMVTAPAGQATGSSTLTVTAAATVQGILETQSVTLTLNVQPVSTTFLGRTVVQNPAEDPLAGVTITMLGVDGNGHPTGCAGTAKSDAAGNFAIPNLPSACVGAQLIRYDGSTVTAPPGVYAGVDLVYTFVAGQVTTPPFVIHLPRIDNAEQVKVKQNASVDQTFTFATIPGLSVTVYAGTVFTLVDGTRPDPFPLIAIQVPVDRLPDQMPMNNSSVGAFIVAFQPANSVASQPVAVTFPNTLNTPPGVQMALDTLDPTKGVMVQYGTGTVTGAGTQIQPDFDPTHPGHRFGLVHFDWHGPMPPPPPKNNPSPDPNKPTTGDPVDPATGLLIVTKTDIAFGGARGQVAIVRTYRTLSGNAGPFGIGTNHNYGYLLDTTNVIRGTGTFVNLIMPDGNQFPFAQQGTNTFATSTIPTLLGAVITSPSSGTYNLRWKSGTVFQFSSPSAFATVAFLNSITDSNGNVTRMMRSNSSQPIQITQIIDPVGRALNLTYDSFNRILSISDPIGRTVQYTYNSQGSLATVTDAAGGVTTYAYDSQNRMTSITDPRGITFLQNSYDSNGHVVQQTAADGGITTLAYTLLNPTVSTSPVLLTAVTDPRGNTTTYHFTPQGFMLDVSDALGQKTVYTRDPGTNQILSTTDALGRVTAYTYDTAGDVTTITRLAGTPNAITTTFTYDLSFNQLISMMDPLGHASSSKHDNAGNLISVTDPLNNQTTFTYDSSGEMVMSSDSMGNTTQFAYANGNIARITDPLGRVLSRVTDAVGREISLTNPLGQTTSYQYDSLNRVTQIVDPDGNQTSFSYDSNGNLLTVTDASGHKTTYTYDKIDRLATRKDPLGNSESYQYDANGNLTQFTDRRGKVTTYTYDALNRRIFAGFGTKPGLTYETTISYAYDSGNRLIQAVDSVTGTIARQFDGLDRLIAEATSQGTINYTYDSAGRRSGMTVAGQTPVNYSHDSAGRLTRIAQGASSVSFTYDSDNRRTSLTLPNGVVANYGYDRASQLVSISYQLGSTNLGNLTYSHDSAGKRVSIGGSFARTGLPATVPNASYNADNQLAQFGSSQFTYDASGNLTSDGVNTYAWDARNHLTAISGSITASFQYDLFGRRVSKTILGKTNGYLYDAMNVVQELSGGTPTANLITGGVDEVFTRADASGTGNFLSDALGSTFALVGGSGNILAEYTYEPFGNTTVNGSSASSYQFTGRENDGTGLYFYRARYYSPTMQRFISEDPAEFYGGGPNLYQYVGNKPTNGSDSTGLWSPEGHDALIQHALAPCGVSASNIKALQDASRRFDSATGQDENWAFAHSMRSPGESVDDAVNKRNDFIANQLDIARLAWEAGDTQYALSQLGWGIHPIMDITSPAHTTPQGDPITWCAPVGCKGNRLHSPGGTLQDLSFALGLGPIGIENVWDITPQIYSLEDQAIRDAYQFVTGSQLSCKKQ